MEGEITPAFCISCFLLGGPACQKKKKGRERRMEKKHLTWHIEKKRALNAIKAKGRNQPLIYSGSHVHTAHTQAHKHTHTHTHTVCTPSAVSSSC